MIEEEDESDTESEDITEAEKKFKMFANDEEMARKVQEEWEAEEEKERLAEEKATKVAFTIEYDFIQARLNVDRILAEKLQEEERKIHHRRESQHVGGKKHFYLKTKIFEEIQVLYEKVKRSDENFIAIGSVEDDKLIEKMNKKAAGMDKEEVAKELESSKVEGPKENIKKRSRRRLKMKAPKRSKRQKTNSNHEEENQLRFFQ
ncbi:hypothetical protein Tco_0640540 [Tanacetum coccineum]